MASRAARHICQAARLRPLRPSFVQVRRNNTAAAAGGAPSAKLEDIVSQISSLTLLETADLVSLLKTRLNITEVAAPAASATPAAAAGGDAAPAAAAAPAEAEKSVFNLKLESFDAAAKAKVIREVKAALGLNLVDAKKFVESAPKVLKEGVTKEDADKIKKALEAAGAVVKLE